MMMKNILYLASKSSGRKKLLEEARIEYQIIEQNADETACDWSLPLPDVVQAIAQSKMEHVIMPKGVEGQISFVLTADTLVIDPGGIIRGKPVDMADAIAMLKAEKGRNRCGTAFCLEKKIYRAGVWHTVRHIARYVEAIAEIDVPDEQMEEFLRMSGSIDAAAAFKVGGYGAQFLKSVEGSYSTIIGLPMFELRQALIELGFY